MKLVTALLVGLLVIATFAPLVVAEPHIEQTPAILAFAHAMQRLAPALSIVVAALLVIRLWRDKSWRAWTLLGVTVACVWLSRVNLLEWIFAGASDTHFANIDDFHDVRDTDMVIGVTIDGQSRAYPVRYLAYHHMLNDRLGHTELLPTY
jgi:Protein of unknown function (DUF3179)